jgi:hypothetical protein
LMAQSPICPAPVLPVCIHFFFFYHDILLIFSRLMSRRSFLVF